MRKSILILIFTSLLTQNLAAQKQDDHWCIGTYTLEYNQGNFTTHANKLDIVTPRIEGSCAMSDSSGQLLFYTNGKVLLDQNDRLLYSFDYISEASTSSYQSNFVLTSPFKKNAYILVHGGVNANVHSKDDSLYCTRFDYDPVANSVQNVNYQFVAKSCLERATIVRHPKGDLLWLIVFKNNYDYKKSDNPLDGLVVYRIDKDTITLHQEIKIQCSRTFYTGIGPLKSSPDGALIAFGNGGNVQQVWNSGSIVLFQFNPLIGRFKDSSEIQLSCLKHGFQTDVIGLTFTSNSRNIYAFTSNIDTNQRDAQKGIGLGYQLLSYDVSVYRKQAIQQSEMLHYAKERTTGFWSEPYPQTSQMLNFYDGYVYFMNSRKLHRIKNPNNRLALQLDTSVLAELGPGTSVGYGLPQFFLSNPNDNVLTIMPTIPRLNCKEGDSVLLQATTQRKSLHVWNTGVEFYDTFSEVYVKKSGWYFVEAWYNGKVIRDSVFVQTSDNFSYNRLDTFFICETDSLKLNFPAVKNPRWSTGDTTAEATFKTMGNYWLEGYIGGCFFRNDLDIRYYATPTWELIQTTEACFSDGQTAMLEIHPEFLQMFWSPTGSEQSSTFAKDSTTVHIIRFKDRYGCSYEDSITANEQCEGFSYYFPNAFSPNHDGLNDLFAPVIRGGYLQHLSIYNRWGGKIFDGSNGWNGIYQKVQVPAGIYLYRAVLLNPIGREIYVNGMVQVLR